MGGFACKRIIYFDTIMKVAGRVSSGYWLLNLWELSKFAI